MNNLENILMTTLSLNSMQQSSSIPLVILSMIGIPLVKQATALIPVVSKALINKCKTRVKEHKIITEYKPNCSIIFERDFTSVSQEYEITDAIIDYLCNLNQTKQLKRKKIFIFNQKSEFQIDTHFYAKLIDIKNNDNEVVNLTFCIYSYTKELSDLREWCDLIHHNYVEKNESKYLNHKCYFNQLNATLFTQTLFSTTKSLDNLFGPHIDDAKKRVDMFTNHKEWYYEKGIPYALGFLLYGTPGCGKTSFIKSIANDTGRHIINLTLTNKTLVSDLHNIFYNTNLPIYHKRTNTTTYINIPLNKRLYVLEDADCLTSIVLDRNLQEKMKVEEKKEEKTYEQMRAEELTGLGETITLSHLLNVLDGILEIEGRMIILTTNRIDDIDSALKRPGRFDCVIEFTMCVKSTIKEMIHHIFGQDVIIRNLDKYANLFTPAEVQEILLKNMYDYEHIYTSFDELYRTKKHRD